MYANYHLKPRSQAFQSVSSLQVLKICSVVRLCTFSEGYVDNHWMSVAGRHLKILYHVRESSILNQGLHGYILKMITSFRTMRQKKILSTSRINVELIRLSGRPVFVHMVQIERLESAYMESDST